MSQTAQSVRLAWPTLLGRRSLSALRVEPYQLGVLGLVAFSLAVRLAGADRQSAYMDEGSNVLSGRMLIEQHAVYAEILNWAYGSYLWPLLAGAADELGGIQAVRGLSAVFGVVMVMATAGLAFKLAPVSISVSRRWGVALLAGGIMAVAPPAVGVSRFGTYDALAGAAFMLGVTLLVPAGQPSRRAGLLAAAVLLFVAFLAKYLVAIYFPFVCVYVVLAAGRRFRVAAHNLVWFVVPLSALCAVYALVFLGPLLNLLSASLHYGDLKSADPLREYVWTRPELWPIVAASIYGWKRAPWSARVVAGGGAAVILAFQFTARADFDFWKHAIYAVYFAAPLAALVWLAVPQNTGTWRVLAAAAAVLAAIWTWSPAIREADRLINFYPNLNSSLAAIDTQVAGSALLLTDDTALRYYLYPRMAADHVVGPFFFGYRGQDGLEGYRRAIADRFFDAIVLDGGVSPQGSALRQQLGDTIKTFYEQVYSSPDGGGFTVEVFKPVRPTPVAGADLAWPVSYVFDAGVDGWGTHPDVGDWQPGVQVAAGGDPTWEGHASLSFQPRADASAVTLRRSGHVTRVRARVYLEQTDSSLTPVRVGFVGFDDAWLWHDDGFRWVVPPGSWTTITWDLASPGDYEEVGLKLPPSVSQAFLGSFEIDP